MSNCDSCSNYQYDEDYECNVCMVDLDEDDMSRFLAGGSFECSFYLIGKCASKVYVRQEELHRNSFGVGRRANSFYVIGNCCNRNGTPTIICLLIIASQAAEPDFFQLDNEYLVVRKQM